FDGISFNRAPRVLALDSILSPLDGNSTLLVLNSLSGDLRSRTDSIGSIFGLLFDDQETGFSFAFSAECQIKAVLSNNFPRTTPRLTAVIPNGRTGWMKLWASRDVGILGAQF